MPHEVPIDLGHDPRVMSEAERMQALVSGATMSHVVRAAILRLAESTPEYEIRVYIREQIYAEHGRSEGRNG